MNARAIVLGVAVVCVAQPAWAICRVVAEKGTVPPVVEPAQPVLLVLQRDVLVGPGCPPPPMQPPPPMMMMPPVEDLGIEADNDGGADAWFDAMIDDAALDDAGHDDAALDDAGDDAGPTPDFATAHDFAAPQDLSTPCSQRRGNAVTMVVQPRFSSRDSSGARFALLMVTPSVPTVSLAEGSLFRGLDAATARQVIHREQTVEDESLGYQCNDPKFGSSGGGGCSGSWDWGGGGGGPSYSPPRVTSDGDGGLPAAASTLGAYQVAVLSADLPSVAKWLDDNAFYYERADLDALRPYVEEGWSVVAIRVRFGLLREKIALDPVAFTYESSSLRLPIAVGRRAAGGTEPLTVFIAADGKYEFPAGRLKYADSSTVASGTNFLTRAELSADVSLPMERDPIAIKRSNSWTFRDSVEVIDVVKIPSSKCPAGSGGCFCGVGGRGGLGGVLAFFGVLGALALRSGARRAARDRSRASRR